MRGMVKVDGKMTQYHDENMRTIHAAQSENAVAVAWKEGEEMGILAK